MHPLSAKEILEIWEWGQDKHPLDRASALLGVACPDLPEDQLQSLTIGQRNSRLLSLREMTLGPMFKGLAVCDQCGASLEFSIAVSAIRRPEPEEREYNLVVNDITIRFRALNSLDLAAIVGIVDAGEARLRLIERCLIAAGRNGNPSQPKSEGTDSF